MATVTTATVLLGAVIIARLIEAMMARRNAERMIADGAEDRSDDSYLLWMALNGGGLFAIAGLMDPEREPPLWAVLAFAPVFLARAALLVRHRRDWILRTLTNAEGDLIEPLQGQYRMLTQGLLAIESTALPLTLDLPWVALGLGLSHVAFIAYRRHREKAHAVG